MNVLYKFMEIVFKCVAAHYMQYAAINNFTVEF